MFFDKPLEELWNYLPEKNEPCNFWNFWEETLQQANKLSKDAEFKKVDYGLELVDTFDVTFSGFDGQAVKGWLLIPVGVKTPLPCVLNFIGYGGGRGLPFNWLIYPSAGYASFVMDTRGQGSSWLQGDTPDMFEAGYHPHFPGFMTLGILDPHSYYYRRVYTDAVQAVHILRDHPLIDRDRIVVTGASQGGGICLAVSGLVSNLAAVMPDVPFLCHFERAVSITDEKPYSEITQYLKVHRGQKSQVFDTLAYFDSMHFVSRAKAPALFSVALMDMVCPPSTVFAAFNHYAGKKDIRIYDFNQHEGGESHHDLEKIKFLKRIFY